MCDKIAKPYNEIAEIRVTKLFASRTTISADNARKQPKRASRNLNDLNKCLHHLNWKNVD